MVRPPGLEPGPTPSEGVMVSNSTTGAFIKLFNFYSRLSKRSKGKFYKLLSTTFYRFKHKNYLFGWVFHSCINVTTRYCISIHFAKSISCVLLWITKNRRRPVLYPAELRIHFFAVFLKNAIIFYYFLLSFCKRLCYTISKFRKNFSRTPSGFVKERRVLCRKRSWSV